MSLSVHHIALRARDTARTERFYVSVLGLEVRRRDPERGSVWLYAAPVVLMIERAEAGEPLPSAGSMDLLAFAVEDREGARVRLAAAGVPIEAETTYTLYFRDPDGRRVGVSTYSFDGPGR